MRIKCILKNRNKKANVPNLLPGQIGTRGGFGIIKEPKEWMDPLALPLTDVDHEAQERGRSDTECSYTYSLKAGVS